VQLTFIGYGRAIAALGQFRQLGSGRDVPGRGLTLFLGRFVGAHPHDLAVPEVSRWWPWPLTPLTSGAVGAWLISVGVAAGQATIEDDVARIPPLGSTAVVLAGVGSFRPLRYGQDLDWSAPAAYGYVAVLATLLVLGIWALRAGGSKLMSQPTAGTSRDVAPDTDVLAQLPIRPAIR